MSSNKYMENHNWFGIQHDSSELKWLKYEKMRKEILNKYHVYEDLLWLVMFNVAVALSVYGIDFYLRGKNTFQSVKNEINDQSFYETSGCGDDWL